MILILSRAHNDLATERVLGWLDALGADVVRINEEDLEYPSRFVLDASGPKPTLTLTHWLTGAERCIDLMQVHSVWFRRWGYFKHYAIHHVDTFSECLPQQFEIALFLAQEHAAPGQALFAALKHAHWLCGPQLAQLDKTRMLIAAREAGLDIPPSLIVSEKKALLQFLAQHGQVIAKNLGRDPLSLNMEDGVLASYASLLDQETVNRLPDNFFPSLVQAAIAKQYELRVFYIEGSFEAVAIFSQNDPQTQVDYRRYNLARPNRMVPYQLSQTLEQRLRVLVHALHFDVGAIDLIRSSDGQDVFLEVNPVGQFGMVSHATHVDLEKKVAQCLLRHDQ